MSNIGTLGVIKEIFDGEVFAIDPDGNIRQLHIGSKIASNERINASKESAFKIELNSGKEVTVPRDLYKHFLKEAIQDELDDAYDIDGLEVVLNSDETKAETAVQQKSEQQNNVEQPETHSHQLAQAEHHDNKKPTEPETHSIELPPLDLLPHQNEGHPAQFVNFNTPATPIRPIFPTAHSRLRPEERVEDILLDQEKKCATVSLNSQCDTITEGDRAQFTLSLDMESDVDIKVTLMFGDEGDTATPGDDYNNVNFVDDMGQPIGDGNMITIPAGETSLDFYVQTEDDDITEFLEKFTIKILSVENVEDSDNFKEPKIDLINNMGMCFIEDNDCSTVSIMGGETVVEGEGNNKFTLSLDKISDAPIKVTLMFGDAGDTATPGVDYNNTNFVDDQGQPIGDGNMITIPAGTQSVDIFVEVFDDMITEFEEKYTIKILTVENVTDNDTIMDPKIDPEHGSAMGFITDNDCSTVSLTGGDTVTEGELVPFKLSLDKISDADIKVTLMFGDMGDTATPGDDYDNTTFYDDQGQVIGNGNMITIPAGEDCVDIYVQTTDDMVTEFKEKFTIKILSVENITDNMTIMDPKIHPEDNSAMGFIIDNDCSTVSLTGGDTVTEGELIPFKLSLDKISDAPIKVTLMFGDMGDTATPGDDYDNTTFYDDQGQVIGNGNMITIPAGEDCVDIYVQTNDDMITEFKEKLTIKILSVENVTDNPMIMDPKIHPEDNSAMGFIIDNDCSTVSLTGGDTVTEGELVPFKLSLDKISDAPIKVTLMFGDAGDTATPGDDYDNTTFYDDQGQVIGNGNMITIPAGEDCVDIYVQTTDDMITEFKEKFTIKILSVENVTDNPMILDPKIHPEDNSAMGFIIDNDCSTVSLTGGDTVTEGELVPFKLSLDKISDVDIKVTLMFGDMGDTATPGDDYDNTTFYDDQGQVIGNGNMITIPAGEDCVDIYVQTTDDMITEFKEKFTIKILSVVNLTDSAMILPPKIDPENNSAMGFIVDNDCSTVSLTGGDTVNEGELVPFKLNLDKISDADIKVTLMFGDAGDTATPGDDYDNTTFYDDQGQVIGNGNMITIPAGEDCVDIYVQTLDDDELEFTEKFSIKITAVENVTDNPMILDPKFDDTPAMGFIIDTDEPSFEIFVGNEIGTDQICVKEDSDFNGTENEIDLHATSDIPLTEILISDLDSSWMYDLTGLEGAGITVTNNINGNGTVLIEFDQPGPLNYWASFKVKPPADSDVDMGVITVKGKAEGFDKMVMGSDTAEIVVDAVADLPMNLSIGPAPGEDFDKFALAIDQSPNMDPDKGAILYQINIDTGETTPLGFVVAPGAGQNGFNLDAEAIVLDPKTGCVFTLAKSTGASDGFYKIDPSMKDMNGFLDVTFLGTGGGILTTNDIDPSGMAFDTDGTLFAIINDGADSLLYTIDTSDSTTMLIGDTDESMLGGLAINQSGDMYAIGKSGNNILLYQLDKSDASVIGMPVQVTGADIENSSTLEALSFDLNGNLISVDKGTGEIFEINPNTGNAVLQSTTLGGNNVSGDGFENIAIDTRLHVCDEFDIKVSALFKDLDGSEDHFFLIELPDGWDTNGTKVVNPDGVPAGTYLLIDVDDMTEMAMDTATLIPPDDLETDTAYWINSYAVAQETSTGDVECDESDNLAVTEAAMLEVVVCGEDFVPTVSIMRIEEGEQTSDVTEGEVACFKIFLEDGAIVGNNVTVDLAALPMGGSATPDSDFDAMQFYMDPMGIVPWMNNSVTIPPGENFVNVYVQTIDDDITEFTEDYTLEISNPMNAVIGTDQAIGNIFDNDCSTVSLTGGDEVNEGELVPFKLSLDKVSDADIKVTLMFGQAGDTATAGDDYDNTTFYDDQGQVIGNGNMITIPAGEDCVDIYVQTNDDMITEFKEKLTIKILSVENVTDNPMILDPKIDDQNNSAMGFIVDNDCSTVSLTGGDTVTEGELIPFKLSLDKLSDADIKVTLMFGDMGDTATPGDDYDNTTFYDDQGQVIGNGNMITIPAGEDCVDIYVQTNDDMITEFKEKLTIKILSVENVTDNPMILDPKIDDQNNSAMGFIVDNDCSTVSLTGGDTVTEGELIPFKLSLDKLSDADIKVTLMFGDMGDTATPGDDYDNTTFYDDQGQVIGNGNMITIPAGEDCVDIYVQTLEDDEVEFTEKFSIKIIAVENVTDNPMILDPKFDDTPAMGFILDTNEPSIEIIVGNEVGGDQVCVKEDSMFNDNENEIDLHATADIPLTEILISDLDSSWMYDLTGLEGAGITVTNNINGNGTVLIEFDQPGPLDYWASFKVKPPADSDVDMGTVTVKGIAEGFDKMVMDSDTVDIVVDAVADLPMNAIIAPAPGEDFDQFAFAIEQNPHNFQPGTGALLYQINLDTGTAIPQGFVIAPDAGGSSGENLDAEAIAFDAKTGCFFMLAKSTGAEDGLYKIDPSIVDENFKLMVTFLGNGGGVLETDNLDPSGMAFDTDGTLFAVINDGSDSLIYTLDTTDSTPTFIGDTGLADLAALAIAPTGEMYSVLKTGNDNLLYQLDKTNGSVIGMPLMITGPDLGSSVVLESLSFDHSGNLISVDQLSGKIFEINPNTGNAVLQSTTIGKNDVTGDGIENIVFDPRIHVCDEFDIKVSALFKDLDGSEDHFFLIELPEGWDTTGTKVVNPDGVPAGTYLLIDVDNMTEMGMDTATLIPPNNLEEDTPFWIQSYAVAQETFTGDVECDDSDNLAVTEAVMLEVVVCGEDFVPTVSIMRIEEGEQTSDVLEGEVACFKVFLEDGAIVGNNVTVELAALPMGPGGTATPDDDFDAMQFYMDPMGIIPWMNNTVTIPSGENSVNVYVKTIDDDIVEDTEDYTLEISNPMNAIMGTDQAIGHIEDNDEAPCKFKWCIDDFSDESVNTYAGEIHNIKTTYSEQTQKFTFCIRIDQKADGYTLAINDGPNPKGVVDELALIYFDASDMMNPKVTIYQYNGENNQTSHLDPGNCLLSSLLDSDSGFFHEISVTKHDDGTQTFKLEVDVSTVNSAINSANWTGIQFDEKMGLWLHPFKYLNTEYNEETGKLTEWEGKQGWYDITDRDTMKLCEDPCPVNGHDDDDCKDDDNGDHNWLLKGDDDDCKDDDGHHFFNKAHRIYFEDDDSTHSTLQTDEGGVIVYRDLLSDGHDTIVGFDNDGEDGSHDQVDLSPLFDNLGIPHDEREERIQLTEKDVNDDGENEVILKVLDENGNPYDSFSVTFVNSALNSADGFGVSTSNVDDITTS